MRIKSTHPESQGEFVIINDADFDPAIHEPSPVVPFLPTGIKGAVPDGSDSAPCEAPPLSAEVAGGGVTSGGASLTIIELRERLKLQGVAFPSNAPKADLVTIFDAHYSR